MRTTDEGVGTAGGGGNREAVAAEAWPGARAQHVTEGATSVKRETECRVSLPWWGMVLLCPFGMSHVWAREVECLKMQLLGSTRQGECEGAA